MKRSGEILATMLDEVEEVGEVPYQANRRAVSAFDVEVDADKGLKEITVLLNGADVLMASLERFENAARKVARGFSSVS
jgi:hypothetical protein